MTITTIPQEVLEAIENHPRAEEKFIGTFENSQEIFKYFPDWWEEKYEKMQPWDILHNWEETCCIHVIPHGKLLYLFGDLDY